MSQPSRIALDVTSFISAEEFILAQNRGIAPHDPFARQCYAEIVQSLIFFDEVAVPHPDRLEPEPDDYGEQPMLLQLLFDLGIIKPLTFSRTDQHKVNDVELQLLDALDQRGVALLRGFVDKTAICDREQGNDGMKPMLRKIIEWSDFQNVNVRPRPSSHKARVGTKDGVEADRFGDWARASAHLLKGELGRLLPDSDAAQLHLIATLARALRYGARSGVKQTNYQAHPLRRDFCVTFDLADGGASDPGILDVVREIRGIHRGLQAAGGLKHRDRLRLLELELPLLGGRLWTSRERGRHNDERWLRLTCGRLSEYRDRASKLRQAMSRCIFEEDKLRLKMDLDRVRERLLQDLGLKSAPVNDIEREIIQDVASVAGSAIGLPIVRPLLIGGRIFGRRLTTVGNAYQKFLYREFKGAWKRGLI